MEAWYAYYICVPIGSTVLLSTVSIVTSLLKELCQLSFTAFAFITTRFSH